MAVVGFSLGVLLISLAMTGNGFAVASNPAWHLISFLRNIFIWTWVLLLAGVAIKILFTIVQSIHEEVTEVNRLRREAERAQSIRSANYNARTFEAKREENSEEVAKKEALKLEQERQERVNREIERRRTRSSNGAIDDALDDF
jgi:uncharacterized protein YlxW (UPF0749 family)